MKKNNNKGFTLAELLIVVAIIAVLVAIAIPIFTTQLEKAREATDFANARSAYAEVMVAAVSGDAPATSANAAYTLSRTGNAGSYVYTAVVTLKQQIAGWTTTSPAPLTAVAGVTATGSPTVGGSCTITYTEASNTTKIVWA